MGSGLKSVNAGSGMESLEGVVCKQISSSLQSVNAGSGVSKRGWSAIRLVLVCNL